MDRTKTIGVFFGGNSPEHDVSIITGQLVISELKKMGYPVIPVYVDRAGRWFSDESLGTLKTFTTTDVARHLESLKPVSLDMTVTGILTLHHKGLLKHDSVIQIAFPTFHGRNGEDGTIQGLFELLNVPFVGCGVTSSAITMDKVLTKLLYRVHSIRTTDYIFVTTSEWSTDQDRLLRDARERFAWPIFVKPARLGSSIGISRATNDDELRRAYELAFHYDDKIIVEQGVDQVTDITCSVLGHHDTIASVVQESLFDDGLLSYEDKYLKDGGAQLGGAKSNIVIPANIPPEITEKVQALSKSIFKLFECSGIARVDFLLDRATGELYANEINTMPGTLYHHLWKESGVPIQSLIEQLLDCALVRQRDTSRFTSSFSSQLLSMAGSIKLQMDKKGE